MGSLIIVIDNGQSHQFKSTGEIALERNIPLVCIVRDDSDGLSLKRRIISSCFHNRDRPQEAASVREGLRSPTVRSRIALLKGETNGRPIFSQVVHRRTLPTNTPLSQRKLIGDYLKLARERWSQQPHFPQLVSRRACPPMRPPWCEGLARRNFSGTARIAFLEGLLLL